MILHGLAGLFSILALLISAHSSLITITEVGLVLLTLGQLVLLLEALRGLSYFKQSYALKQFEERDLDIQSIQVWLEAEVLLRIGIMFACILYMIVRKIIREKYSFRINSYEKAELRATN